MKIETWKEIPGTDGRYHVSDEGNIFDYLKAKKLKCSESETMGKHVQLYIDGKQHHKSVAKLVYEAFKGEKVNNSFKIKHIDGDRLNCHVDNLCYAKKQYNVKPINRRDKNGILQGIFRTIEEAAKAVGANEQEISNAIDDKTMCKGYYWDRKEIRYISQGAFVGKTTSYHEGIDEMDIGITPNYNVKHLTGEELRILNSLIFAELKATNRNYLNNLKQAG